MSVLRSKILSRSSETREGKAALGAATAQRASHVWLGAVSSVMSRSFVVLQRSAQLSKPARHRMV